MHMLTIKIGTIRSKLKVVVFGEYESRAQVYYIFKVIQLVLVGGETQEEQQLGFGRHLGLENKIRYLCLIDWMKPHLVVTYRIIEWGCISVSTTWTLLSYSPKTRTFSFDRLVPILVVSTYTATFLENVLILEIIYKPKLTSGYCFIKRKSPNYYHVQSTKSGSPLKDITIYLHPMGFRNRCTIHL